jgi:hypothetical protein
MHVSGQQRLNDTIDKEELRLSDDKLENRLREF